MTYLRTNHPRPNVLHWPLGLGDLETQLDTLFAGLPGVFDRQNAAARQPETRAAKLRWYEKDDAYLVRIDLAGVRKEDVQIELEEGAVSVSAVRKFEPSGVEKQSGEVEYANTFRVPDGVQAGAIAANFENGVLSLTLPKSKKAQPRRIAIS